MSTNQIALRNAFKSVKAAYAENDRFPIITPSDLRLECVLAQNKTTYQFALLQSDTNVAFASGVSNTELRLNQNDSFWAVLAGLYIAKPASATDAEYNLNSYPSKQLFSTVQAAAYQTIFNNSTLSIGINNVAYIQNFLTSRFRNAGIAQLGAGATSSTAVPANVPSTMIDSFDGNESGITALGTLIEFSGQKKADIRLNLPAALSTAPAEFDRVILVLRGFLALNSATR